MIGSAVSSWLIIDRTTKKIQRPDGLLSQYNDSNLIISTSVRNPEKLHESAENGNSADPFRVKVSDLDINLHTNNANYIKWICDSYNLNFTLNHLPCSAEINYLAESIFDDEIFIRSSRDVENKNIVNHSIIRISDNKELCRIRIKWKENV